ncbi:MAG TPA: hypothetical protein VNT28_04950 [Candidatus Limnocylindrales bacterium]|jgi:hypothetical protein|nr:hypothetical protein [Candidatus Limnocylindrales bacterium]
MNHPPARGWWAGKTRQFARHVFGRVNAAERSALSDWLTAAQLELFEQMHRADQRHGLDVVGALRAQGHEDPELLLAGLLHDCGKARDVGVWHRVGWSLAERYGSRVRRAWALLPGFDTAFQNLDRHAERSAELCRAAGCGERVAELVRLQADPGSDAMGQALRLADEAS